MRNKLASENEKSLMDLYERPGFMLRRAYQISVSIFLAEIDGVEVTTTQYGVLVILKKRDSLDQIGLSKLVGLDRSTTAIVVGKLETAGYVVRQDDPNDRRRKILALTPSGADALKRLSAPAERARLKVLSAFSASATKLFLALLKKFVNELNHIARAPTIDDAKAETSAAVQIESPPRKTRATAAPRARRLLQSKATQIHQNQHF
jgi:DNA-binding MarR family transcriptional regulator